MRSDGIALACVSSDRSPHVLGSGCPPGPWGEPGRPEGRPGCSTEEAPAMDAPSDDYEIPAEVQSDWPAMAQMADAGSKPSLTTVVSMLAALTQVAVRRRGLLD